MRWIGLLVITQALIASTAACEGSKTGSGGLTLPNQPVETVRHDGGSSGTFRCVQRRVWPTTAVGQIGSPDVVADPAKLWCDLAAYWLSDDAAESTHGRADLDPIRRNTAPIGACSGRVTRSGKRRGGNG